MSRHHARRTGDELPRPRRSQAERAEQMRARLLDATIECLATSGYGRMSTNDVVRKARVSRGALAHHFPTKADLVKAAAQRLVEARAEQFHERFAAIAPQRRTPAEALTVLWSFYDDPTGLALIELTFAARSHRELHSLLDLISKQIEKSTAEVVAEYFPDLAALPFIEEVLRLVHATYAGLALSSQAGAEAIEHAAEVRAFMKLIASTSTNLDTLRSTA
jgi:AcrR family transcriptional regulator